MFYPFLSVDLATSDTRSCPISGIGAVVTALLACGLITRTAWSHSNLRPGLPLLLDYHSRGGCYSFLLPIRAAVTAWCARLQYFRSGEEECLRQLVSGIEPDEPGATLFQRPLLG